MGIRVGTADVVFGLDELGVDVGTGADVGEGKGVIGMMVDVGGGGVGPGMVGAAVGVMPSTASATVTERLDKNVKKNVRKSATTSAIWMMPALVSILAFIILISPPCLRFPWLPWVSYAPRIIIGKKIELGKSTTIVFNSIAGSPKR